MRLPILSLAIDRTPLPIIRRVTEQAFGVVLRQHPGLFDRLGPHARKSYRFTPDDLDLSFLVLPQHPRMIVSRKADAGPADAAVSGPMLILLALLEGRIDADALFFARQLSITGDMEAMLALRNALDDNGFDLPRDIAGRAGPLSEPLIRLAEWYRGRVLAEFT